MLPSMYSNASPKPWAYAYMNSFAVQMPTLAVVIVMPPPIDIERVTSAISQLANCHARRS